MSQPTHPIAPGNDGARSRTIIVELGTQPLPTRMRMGGLRRSLGVPTPGRHVMQRLLMAPVAMLMRVFSR